MIHNQQIVSDEYAQQQEQLIRCLKKSCPHLQVTINPNIFESKKPFIVSDVDDVILDFLNPFVVFMQSWNCKYVPNGYDLYKNFYFDNEEDKPLDTMTLTTLLHAFFAKYVYNLALLGDAKEYINILSQDYHIIFLTLLPPEYHDIRRRNLSNLGLSHTLLSIRNNKGPVVKAINDFFANRVHYFVDDKPSNLSNVSLYNPDVKTVHFVKQMYEKIILEKLNKHFGTITVNNWQNFMDDIKK